MVFWGQGSIGLTVVAALGLAGVRPVAFDVLGELSAQAAAFFSVVGVPLLRRDSLPNMAFTHKDAARCPLTNARAQSLGHRGSANTNIAS